MDTAGRAMIAQASDQISGAMPSIAEARRIAFSGLTSAL